MTPEEIKERLKEAGIPVGDGWGPTKQQTSVEPPVVKRQKDALRKIEALLVEQVEQDKQRVADLKEDTFQVGHGVQLQNRVWPHLTHIQCVDFSIEIQDETLRKIRVTAISGTSTVQLN